MLTYSFAGIGEKKLYTHLYDCIRRDILSGKLPAGTRLPSKRSFAANLGVSVITVENAYAQLVSEGYVHAQPRRGFFVARGQFARAAQNAQPVKIQKTVTAPEKREDPDTVQKERLLDLSENRTAPENFPFSTWAKLMRAVISEQSGDLMRNAPIGGVAALREAIASHLGAFRGMPVRPENIVVGAGTEYLCGLLAQLFGAGKIWAVEDPGYRKAARIYESYGDVCRYLPVDDCGVSPQALRESGADLLHISPAHQYPTGAVTPVSRLYEILDWALQGEGRYIVEDDYDSEFRFSGRPAPPLMSLDTAGRVVYMNTFTKSLSSTVRISYMVLPDALLEAFREKLGFYACTVPNLEQYTLARFIGEGFFEKHLNRMRKRYRKKRDLFLAALLDAGEPGISVTGAGAGLHFLLHVENVSARAVLDAAAARGVKILPLSAYRYDPTKNAGEAVFPVCYAQLRDEDIGDAAKRLLAALRAAKQEINLHK